MKKYAYIQYTVALILLSSAAFTFSSCGGGGDDPTPSEKQMKLLVGTWNINSVKVDGVDYTNLFTGFTLTIADAPPTYTVANGGKVWTSDGTLIFTDNTATVFVGPDAESVTITSLTSNSLVLEMQWNRTTLGGGRGKSISGRHVFTFTR